MQKWEYIEVLTVYGKVTDMRIIPSKGKPLFSDRGDVVPQFSEYLDSLGAEGWEMVNAQNRDVGMFLHTTYYFKRPID